MFGIGGGIADTGGIAEIDVSRAEKEEKEADDE